MKYFVTKRELAKLRKDSRGTTMIDTGETDGFWLDNNGSVILKWNGYNCDLLTLDGNTAEVFIA